MTPYSFNFILNMLLSDAASRKENFENSNSETSDTESESEEIEENEYNPLEFLERTTSASLFISMRESKNFTIKCSSFSEVQDEVTLQTRLVVVDWIYRVVQTIHYNRETLFNSVALLDHILSKVKLTKKNIQLYAATCLWISVKLYETRNRELSVFTAVCHYQFSQDEFLHAEIDIVANLEGKIEFPTPQIFISALLIDLDLNDCEEMCNFFLDMSLTVNYLNEYPPYVVAAADIIAGSAALNKECPIIKMMTIIRISDQAALYNIARKIVDIAETILEKKAGYIYSFYPNEVSEKIKEAIKFLEKKNDH